MNVVMVTEIYLPIWGGAENQLRQLIPHLEDRGVNVSIVTRRWYGEWDRHGEVDGVSVTRLGIAGKGPVATTLFILDLVRHIVAHRSSIDILHSHGAVNMGGLCSLLARLLKRKNVAKIASAGRIPEFSRSIAGRVVLGLLKKSDAIISMTDEIDEELLTENTSKERLIRITNGVDVTRFHPGTDGEKAAWRKQHGLEDTATIILFSSRLVYGKGLDILIGAWREVVKTHPDCYLLVVGSGKDQKDAIEEEMRALVSSEPVDNVLFHGATSTPERFLAIADIFVFPSRREGFPNALMEAMAAGLPVIASDIGGVRPLMKSGVNGVMFTSEDSKSLERQMCELLSDREARNQLGQIAREDMKGKYKFSLIADQYLKLYAALKRGADDVRVASLQEDVE